MKYDHIGDTLFYLSQVATAPGMSLSQILRVPDHKEENRGMVIVQCEEVIRSNTLCHFRTVECQGLPNVSKLLFGIFHVSCPSLWLCKSTERKKSPSNL